MFKKPLILLTLILVSILATAQEKDELISAISVEHVKDNIITISGICTNNSQESKEIKYVLSVQKKSQSGNTNNNKQSGKSYIKPKESKTLSTTTINFEPVDHTEIVLTIFDEDNVKIAQHTKLLSEVDLIKS